MFLCEQNVEIVSLCMTQKHSVKINERKHGCPDGNYMKKETQICIPIPPDDSSLKPRNDHFFLSLRKQTVLGKKLGVLSPVQQVGSYCDRLLLVGVEPTHED